MNLKEEPKVEHLVSSVPRPLDCFRNPPIPPFLSKTYDLVDDSALDPIISWGSGGTSFVVWDPMEFSRSVLPKHFKHNNFSSFVRQLNTYGFHKIGTDKWEFANEDFLRGERALLKHISRRRTSQVHQNSTHAVSSSSLGMGKGHLVEDEIAKLKKDKDSLMQEIIQLRQENVLNFGRLESLNDRLSSAEVRQRQMVSFLAKVLRNPVFIGHLRRLKEQRGIEYATRAKRKFLRHCSSSLSSSSAITLNDTTESDNGKQKQAPDDRLKNVSENIEVDICGESSQSFKGKTIMKEMDAMDPIFSASEDDYLLSLPENIIINSESEVERNTHENLLFSDAIVPTNDGGVDEAWDGLDVGTGENLLSGDNAWDMNLADYSNDQNSLWDVGLNAAEDDLDIDKYIAGASLLEEFKIGAQLNQDPKL